MTDILAAPFTVGRYNNPGYQCMAPYGELSDQARYISGEFNKHISRINYELEQQKENSDSLNEIDIAQKLLGQFF